MPGLKGLEAGTREHSCQEHVGLWLSPVVLVPTWCGFPKTQWLWCLPNTDGPSRGEEGSIRNGQMARFYSFYGHAQYDSLLSLVLFRWVATPL
jgi:hypothetical protein